MSMVQCLGCRVNAAFRPESQPHVIGTRALACRAGSKHRGIGAMPWRQRKRCVPGVSRWAEKK